MARRADSGTGPRDRLFSCSLWRFLTSLVSVSDTPPTPRRCRTVPRVSRQRGVSRGTTPASCLPGLRLRRVFLWERRSALVGSWEPFLVAVSPPWGCWTWVCHFSAVAAGYPQVWGDYATPSRGHHLRIRPAGDVVTAFAVRVTTRFAR